MMARNIGLHCESPLYFLVLACATVFKDLTTIWRPNRHVRVRTGLVHATPQFKV
jgi:hypothetical protein